MTISLKDARWAQQVMTNYLVQVIPTYLDPDTTARAELGPLTLVEIRKNGKGYGSYVLSGRGWTIIYPYAGLMKIEGDPTEDIMWLRLKV